MKAIKNMNDTQKKNLMEQTISKQEVSSRIISCETAFETDGYSTLLKLVMLYNQASLVNDMEFDFEINTNSKDKNDRACCANKKANFGKIALACMIIAKQARETRMHLKFGVDPKKRFVTLEMGA